MKFIRRSTRLFAFVMLVILTGCQSSPPIYPNADVYLIRGHRDWYSTGVDKLGATLSAAHREAVVLPQSMSGRLGDTLANAPTRQKPIVLIGFSYGADDAIRIARRLAKVGQPVDLLITIDPVTPTRVPANVKRCINYYQSNGIADVLPWLRGVPLKAETGKTSLTNFDLRKTRVDLLEPGTSHATISSNEKLHVEIVNETIGVTPAIVTLSPDSKDE